MKKRTKQIIFWAVKVTLLYILLFALSWTLYQKQVVVSEGSPRIGDVLSLAFDLLLLEGAIELVWRNPDLPSQIWRKNASRTGRSGNASHGGSHSNPGGEIHVVNLYDETASHSKPYSKTQSTRPKSHPKDRSQSHSNPRPGFHSTATIDTPKSVQLDELDPYADHYQNQYRLGTSERNCYLGACQVADDPWQTDFLRNYCGDCLPEQPHSSN